MKEKLTLSNVAFKKYKELFKEARTLKMNSRKRKRSVRSETQSQKKESLSIDNKLLQSSKSNDNKLVTASIKDRDIINYVNLYSECFEDLGIEPVLVPSGDLNSKNFKVCEAVDIHEIHLAYEFFKSEILPESNIFSTKNNVFSKVYGTIESQNSLNKINPLNLQSKLQQKVSKITKGNKEISLNKNRNMPVKKSNNLISRNNCQLEINNLQSKLQEKISKIAKGKKEISISENLNMSVKKSNTLISGNKCKQEVNKGIEKKPKKISVSKAAGTKKLVNETSFENVFNIDSENCQQKDSNNKEGAKKLSQPKKDNKSVDNSNNLIPGSKSQLQVSNNSIKKKTKKIFVPKAVKKKEFCFDNVSSINSDKSQSKLNDLKNLKITISNQESTNESKIKEKKNGFENYNVIIKSNNISCNEINSKLQKHSINFNENKNCPHINNDFGMNDKEAFSNKKKSMCSETPASIPIISKVDEEKVSNNTIENCSEIENESIPNDYLALAKHMKVTLQDSNRTLQIDPDNKNYSKCHNLKRKHTAVISKNKTKSMDIKRPRKMCKYDTTYINIEKAKKEETLGSGLNNTILKDSCYEDDILSTIMDEEVLLELQDEENVLSSEEIVSPEKCDHSYDTYLPIDSISSNYNLQLDCVKTPPAAVSDSSSDSESSFKRKKNKHSYQFQSHLSQSLIKNTSSEIFCNIDNQSSSNLGSVSDRNSSSSSTSFNKIYSTVLSSEKKTLNITSDVFQGASTSSLKSEVFQTGDLNEVLKSIGEFRTENNIQKAVSLCQKYLPLREPEEKLKIFITLFINIINSIKNLDSNSNFESLFNDVYLILQENNLYNSEVCSIIIFESFSSGLKLPIAFQVFEKCIDCCITISEEAILAYADFLYFQENVSGLLAISDYTKTVCDVEIPKRVLNYLLKLSVIKFEHMLEPQFEKLCSIFCSLNLIQIDDCDMIMFFKRCIENDYWLLISSIFASWSTKGLFPFIHNIYFAFAVSPEIIGNSFEKFAVVLLGNSSWNQNEIFCLFSQIGVGLMLEAYVNDSLDSALKVLMLMHKHNVNYVDLQPSVCQIYSNATCKPCINSFNFVFKETIIHTVVNILMHFRRSKDAFDVFQGFFESVLFDVKDTDLKTYLLLEKYTTVLNIAPLLISSDLLDRSLRALHILLSVEEQGLTAESVESFAKNVTEIYNRCLSSLLNEEKLEMVLELLDRKYGEFKENLRVFHCVRRGLVVACYNKGMIEKAKRLFYVGYIKKTYIFPKINKDEYPSYLTIKSCWSSYEIKFAIELYFQKIHPFLKSKDKGKSMKCFSIRIRVKPQTVESTLVNCLLDIPSDDLSCEKRIRDILLDLDPTLECIEKLIEAKTIYTKCLEISPDIFYNYWKSKLCSPVKNNINRNISVNFEKRISFGMNEPERKAHDFKKISNFLLAKLFLQNDGLNAETKQQKAESLAISFIKENEVLNKLDRRTMKLLSEFSEKLV